MGQFLIGIHFGREFSLKIEENTLCEIRKTQERQTERKMRRLTRCCCCSVRTGAQVVAGLSISFGVLALVAYSTGLAMDIPGRMTDHVRLMATKAWNNQRLEEATYRNIMKKMDTLEIVSDSAMGTVVAGATIQVVLASLLLTGISKNKHKWMVPWLIFAAISIALNVVVCVGLPIFHFVAGNPLFGGLILLAAIPTVTLWFYFVWVVHSEYNNIRDANSNAEKGTMVGPPCDQPYKIMAA